MNQIVLTMISFVAIAIVIFGFVGFYLRGWIGTYIKVRASRGGKVMVKVRNPLVDYFVVGVPEGKMVNMRLRGKRDVKLTIPDTAYYRMLGIVCVDIDEESGAVVTRDYNIVSSYDPVVNNNLHVRALTAPKDKDKQDIIVIVLIVLTILILLFVAFKVNSLGEQVELLKSGANTVTGVNL